MTTHSTPGPHSTIRTSTRKERFLAELFDRLWSDYRSRVPYVQTYEEVVKRHGGTFVNDHIAFRTLGVPSAGTGMHTLGRLFDALGYRAAGTYAFDDKHLAAIHFQHAIPDFPKLFVSELKTWELPVAERTMLEEIVADGKNRECELLPELFALDQSRSDDFTTLLERTLAMFNELAWPVPQRSDVERFNAVSQYGAWVLVHGYRVNHFTSLINSHGTPELDSIEKTIAALQAAGVPMKAEIEGEPSSKLRQTATEAVMLNVPMREGDAIVKHPWTYAYFELAQRDWMTDLATGGRYRFEGFLGAQATALFEMTRLKG